MQLAPLEAGPGRCITLHLQNPTTVGRLDYNAQATAISRQACTVTAQPDGGGVLLTAHKPVYIQQQDSLRDVKQLQQGQSCQLCEGDIVYLLKTTAGASSSSSSYTAGFRLQSTSGSNNKPANPSQQQQQGSPAAAQSSHAVQSSSHAANGEEPAPKRHKAAAAAAPAPASPPAEGAAQHANTAAASPAANTPTAAAAHCAQSQPASTPGSASKVAAAAQAGCGEDVRPASQQQQQQPGAGQLLFTGLQLVDWDGHHTNMALQKAAEEGATVSQWLDSSTTHVIARYELSADEVRRKLSAQTTKQQQQRQPRHSATALKKHSPAGKSTRSSSPGQLQQSYSGDQPLAGNPQLPPGMQFVTVSWLTQSLKSRRRLPETQFHTDLQRQLHRSRSGAHTHLEASPAAVDSKNGPVATSPAATSPTAAAAAAAGPGQDEMQQQLQQQEQESKVQRRVQKQQVVVPGPDEMCPAGAAWGTGDRWIEPWDDAAALSAMESLMAWWHQTTARHGKTSTAAAAGVGTPITSPHSTAPRSSLGGRQSDDDSNTLPFQQPSPAGQQLNGGGAAAAAAAAGGGGRGSGGGSVAYAGPAQAPPCDHTACSQQAFCLVEEMERLKRNYHGRVDQFRIKAASRTILELERLQQPIVTPQDIEVLPIGDKSKQKLAEILLTGRLRRNELLEGSEFHRTIQLFMTVWGCADSTARKWWAEGCRSLDDVRHKASSLTAIQQMGLRHYEDFERRIPRAEVAEAVRIIRDTTLDVLQGLTGKPRADLSHLLHVRALGSFVRGKQDTGDIDMLLAPGPAAEEVSPGTLAASLLHALQDRGYVPEGLSLDHRGHSLDSAERVSWMGVWRGPSSPCNRRLDIKTYQRQALPYAVLYFSSGQDCSRALRYWCNKPPPEAAALAAQVHPAANAFHLSDTGLYAVHNPKLPLAAATAAAAAAVKEEQQQQAGAGGGRAAMQAAAQTSPQQAATAQYSSTPDYDELMESAMAAGIPVVSADGHGPTGPAGRVECSCETDVFKAMGLVYVPPHLRSWY